MHTRVAGLGALAIAGALLMGCPGAKTDAGPGTDASETDAGPKGPTCQGAELLVDDGRPSPEFDTCVRPPAGPPAPGAELCNVSGEDFCDDTLAAGTPPRLAGCLNELSDDVDPGVVVLMHGIVDLFGEGNDTLGVSVTLYAVDDVNGAALAGPVEASTPCTAAEDPEAAPSGAECPAGVWCLAIPAGTFCGEAEDPAMNSLVPVGTGPENSFLSYYEIADVPAGVPLVAKNEQNMAADPLVDTYQYDVVLSDEGAGQDEQNVNIITFAAWLSIPATTSVTMITPGNGVIAGTIHDCDDIRIGNATIGFSSRPGVIAYFNGVFGDPTPDPSRTLGTNIDGIYAALDIAPGVVRAEAEAYVGGVLSAGGYDVQVFPDSVTLLTLRGRSYTPAP
jgi:hypothetical protein